MKIVKQKSTENCHFYSREKSLYVPWVCFRNDYVAGEAGLNICFLETRLTHQMPVFSVTCIFILSFKKMQLEFEAF